MSPYPSIAEQVRQRRLVQVEEELNRRAVEQAEQDGHATPVEQLTDEQLRSELIKLRMERAK